MRGGVLIVSGEKNTEKLGKALERRSFVVGLAASVAQARKRLDRTEYDVLLVDLEQSDGEGIRFCEELREEHPDSPVIIVAPLGTLDSALRSMRAGAYDYLHRPLRIEEVAIALDRAAQHRRLRREVLRLREAVAHAQGFDEIIGDSPAMRELYELLEQVASSDVPVLITGETGTGKEVVARAIHRRSKRHQGAFVPVNCAAIPGALLEAELFGFVRGSFTDARSDRRGLFVQANGGAIFLDEIGEMPLALQPKILRALQQRTVRPVGSDSEIPYDARVITATNRDLETAVAEGRFRSDLYYRIDVLQVDVPPLRSRGADILLLAQHFVSVAATRSDKEVLGLTDKACRVLLNYPWPGNVRELENCMERAVALTRDQEIHTNALPKRIRSYSQSHVIVASDDPLELVPMEVVEDRYIRRVLQAVRGNKSTAARILGFDRKTLYRKLKRYGIGEGPGTADADEEERP